MPPDAPESTAAGTSEDDALLADSVGLAGLVVLDRLTPDERLAFVLHDMFSQYAPRYTRAISRRPRRGRPRAPEGT